MSLKRRRRRLSILLIMSLIFSLFPGSNPQSVKAVTVEGGLIPQDSIKATATSYHPGEGPEKTLDGNPQTKWHTAWDDNYSPLPHSLIYDLGESYDGVYRLAYLPRQDKDWNGVITAYEISVSNDGEDYIKVAEGTWDKDKTEKTATFDAHQARFVKFTALESVSDSGLQYGSAAEIKIYHQENYSINRQPLKEAIEDAQKFMESFNEGEFYLQTLQVLLKDAEILYKSDFATEEEIHNRIILLNAEIERVATGELQIDDLAVVYAPESYPSTPISNLLDGDPSTFYETNWLSNGRFYEPGDYIVFDLQEVKKDVGKIIYTPRQDNENGRIQQYKIYVSTQDIPSDQIDGTQEFLDENFTLIGSGKWDPKNITTQSATFISHDARYVAVQALSTGGSGDTLSIAEIEIYQKAVDLIDKTRLQTVIDQFEQLKAGNLHPHAIEFIDRHLTEMKDLETLTLESVENFTLLFEDLYSLYENLGHNTSIRNGEIWLDTDGVPIQAHGGGVLFDEKTKTYYWYGEDKTEDNLPWAEVDAVPVTGVRAYSSKDLYNWKNEGVVLPVFNNPRFGADELPKEDLPLYLDENSDEYKNYGEEFDPNRKIEVRNKDEYYTGTMKSPANTLSKHHSPEQIAALNELYSDKTNEEKQRMYRNFNWDKVVERPKVIYNKKTDKYIMWWHHDGPIAGTYWLAEGGVAISDSPTGPFKYLGTFRMPNVGADNGNEGMLRDMTLFVDDDETGYIIFSSEENEAMIVMQLDEEYTAPATSENGESIQGIHWERVHKNRRESPAVFKQDDVYYMITSGLTGWNPNPAKYHVSSEGIFGPWVDKGDPMVNDTEGTTFRSQNTFVLPYRDENGEVIPDKFIFMADRWNPKDLKDSRYIWLPFELDRKNHIIRIHWQEEWTLDQLKGLEILTDLPKVITIDESLTLPEEIEIRFEGERQSVVVEWQDDVSTHDPGKLEITGTIGALNDRAITHELYVIPENTVYFVNPSKQSTVDYEKIVSYMGESLLNREISDQAYDPENGNTWGYSGGDTMIHDGGQNIYHSLRHITKDSVRKDIRYTFELENGKYTIYAGFYDPWSQWAYGKRKADVIVNDVTVDLEYMFSDQYDVRKYEDINVSDGILEMIIQPSASVAGLVDSDPQISWIMVVDETRSEEAEEVEVTGITIDQEKVELKIGEEFELQATVLPMNASNQKVHWASSDTTIATVDENGKVIAHQPGVAIVTVTTEDGGFTASSEVVVLRDVVDPGDEEDQDEDQATGGKDEEDQDEDQATGEKDEEDQDEDQQKDEDPAIEDEEKEDSEKQESGKELPNTATNIYNWILLGFLMIGVGMALWGRKLRNES